MKIIICIISVCFFSGITGCSEGENSQKDLSVSFKFQLLDKHGVPFTAFREGENIIFSFQIINFSQEIIFFQSMETDEFMEVYLINTTGAVEPVSVGKPYSDIFCDGDLSISPYDTLKMEIPWVAGSWNRGEQSFFCGVNENTLLSQGHYKTEFTTAFDFIIGNKLHTTELQEFEIEFDVYISCEGEFKDKPLDFIRSCIVGKWKFFRLEGGFGGLEYYYTNFFIRFKMLETGDSIIWMDNDVVWGEKIKWIYDEDEYGNKTYFRMDKVGSGGLEVKEIRNDTLLLQDLSSEPFRYHLSRMTE